MSHFTVVFILALVIGLLAVASNPSPYYAAFGLVVAAGGGCGVLVAYGGHFLCLVLFLIYLGGMLVVFAYSAALAAEPYPQGLGDWPVLLTVGAYALGLVVTAVWCWKGWYDASVVSAEMHFNHCVVRVDVAGVSEIYSWGGSMLIIAAWVLLLTLFGVLELTRGLSRGALRAV